MTEAKKQTKLQPECSKKNSGENNMLKDNILSFFTQKIKAY
jgi:hypothetical protein